MRICSVNSALDDLEDKTHKKSLKAISPLSFEMYIALFMGFLME